MNTDLINRVAQAVAANAIPAPVQGETIDDFRFRTAHAGALVALQWVQEQALLAEAEAARTDTQGQPSDVNVTSPDVTDGLPANV